MVVRKVIRNLEINLFFSSGEFVHPAKFTITASAINVTDLVELLKLTEMEKYVQYVVRLA